jgi:hypothetical protein
MTSFLAPVFTGIPSTCLPLPLYSIEHRTTLHTVQSQSKTLAAAFSQQTDTDEQLFLPDNGYTAIRENTVHVISQKSHAGHNDSARLLLPPLALCARSSCSVISLRLHSNKRSKEAL